MCWTNRAPLSLQQLGRISTSETHDILLWRRPFILRRLCQTNKWGQKCTFENDPLVLTLFEICSEEWGCHWVSAELISPPVSTRPPAGHSISVRGYRTSLVLRMNWLLLYPRFMELHPEGTQEVRYKRMESWTAFIFGEMDTWVYRLHYMFLTKLTPTTVTGSPTGSVGSVTLCSTRALAQIIKEKLFFPIKVQIRVTLFCLDAVALVACKPIVRL